MPFRKSTSSFGHFQFGSTWYDLMVVVMTRAWFESRSITDWWHLELSTDEAPLYSSTAENPSGLHLSHHPLSFTCICFCICRCIWFVFVFMRLCIHLLLKPNKTSTFPPRSNIRSGIPSSPSSYILSALTWFEVYFCHGVADYKTGAFK